MAHPGAQVAALRPQLVRRVVAAVLDAEQAGPAEVSVTFLSPAAMRRLHRRALGHDRATDVVAYRLPHDDGFAGDLYLCPGVARASARDHGIPLREELIRLLVHGTLHLLGYDHPLGTGRTRSAMWRRQERYLRRILRREGQPR